MAIEVAVNGTKATAAQVYNRVMEIIQGDIDCAQIFGQQVR